MPPLTIKQIMTILPHRFPYLLVDRVLEQEPGVSAVCAKNVSVNEPWAQGHTFELTGPIYPATQMLETMAQTGGLVLFGMDGSEDATAVFTGLDKFRVRRQVIPGDQVIITAKYIRHKGPLYWVSVFAKVGEETAAAADILLTLLKPESAATETEAPSAD